MLVCGITKSAMLIDVRTVDVRRSIAVFHSSMLFGNLRSCSKLALTPSTTKQQTAEMVDATMCVDATVPESSS